MPILLLWNTSASAIVYDITVKRLRLSTWLQNASIHSIRLILVFGDQYIHLHIWGVHYISSPKGEVKFYSDGSLIIMLLDFHHLKGLQCVILIVIAFVKWLKEWKAQSAYQYWNHYVLHVRIYFNISKHNWLFSLTNKPLITDFINLKKNNSKRTIGFVFGQKTSL